MTLSLADIDSWDTGALESFSHQLGRRSRTLADLGTSVQDAAKIPGWMGQGADAAKLSFARLSDDISDRAATVGAITELVASLIDQVKALMNALDDARDHAARFGLVITDDGAVIDGPGSDNVEAVAGALGGSAAVAAAAASKAAKEAARAEITTHVHAILATAADVEADTTAILTKAAEGGFTGDGMSVEDASTKGRAGADRMFDAPMPPRDIEQQKHYLDTLSPEQQQELLAERPHLLAEAYGIDPKVRDEAIRNWIPQLREDLLDDRADLLRLGHGSNGDLVVAIDKKLADLDMLVDQTNNPPGTPDEQKRYLLGLKQYEDGIGAIVAQNDITTADHVAVHVPGMTTTTRDNPEAGTDLVGEFDKLTRLEQQMNFHLVNDGRDHETVATVTYMNMKFPGQDMPVLNAVAEAGQPTFADEAAPDLARALEGIKATGTEGNHLTVLGHSYGSLTTSEGLQAGGPADDVVFYGSPGLESSGEPFDADSLGVGPDNRYVMLAAKEPIQAAVAFGPFGGRPQDNPDLTRLDAGANAERGLVDSIGHSQYELEDSTSLWNLGAVASGTPDKAIAFDRQQFDQQNYYQTPFGRIPDYEF